MQTTKLFLSLALGALLGACLAQPNDNMQPVAAITVNGMTAQSGSPPLVLPPSGGMVTLDGTRSGDPDGSITEFMWWNTGTPSADRFPMGSTLATGAEVFQPDLGKAASAMVPATNGAVYSLYVIDDDGQVSKPATVKFRMMP